MKMKQTIYDINEHTMVLAPARMIEYSTIAIEERASIYTGASARQVIDHACLKRWTTYEGRRAAVMKHTTMRRKVPIPICPVENITFFPTHAVNHFDNHWLSLGHIMRVESLQTNKANIIFTNEVTMQLPSSTYMIEKQMERAFECLYRMKHGIINENPPPHMK